MSADRLIHLVVGIVLLLVMLYRLKTLVTVADAFILLGLCALGTWVPDWDLMLGIGFHRSPLSHSILPWFVFYYFYRKYKLRACVSIGFAIGIASHLLWDTLFYGDVRWIKGGDADRLFLLINSLILLGVSYFQILKTYTPHNKGSNLL